MTIGKISKLKAIVDAEAVLKNNPELSGDVKAMTNLLLLVIELLVDKLGLNSQNSSIPPSKDPLRKKGLREKSGKKVMWGRLLAKRPTQTLSRSFQLIKVSSLLGTIK